MFLMFTGVSLSNLYWHVSIINDNCMRIRIDVK